MSSDTSRGKLDIYRKHYDDRKVGPKARTSLHLFPNGRFSLPRSVYCMNETVKIMPTVRSLNWEVSFAALHTLLNPFRSLCSLRKLACHPTIITVSVRNYIPMARDFSHEEPLSVNNTNSNIIIMNLVENQFLQPLPRSEIYFYVILRRHVMKGYNQENGCLQLWEKKLGSQSNVHTMSC